MRKRVEVIPVLGLLSSRGWGRNNYTCRDCPPQMGAWAWNDGHSHHDQIGGFSNTVGTRLWKDAYKRSLPAPGHGDRVQLYFVTWE